MITHNIDVPNGLVNGQMATVVKMYTKCILIRTRNQHSGLEREHYLTLAREQIEYNNQDYFIYNFPIRVAYCATVHKVQGNTLDEIVIDCNHFFVQGAMAYVAISRARKLNGIHLLNVKDTLWPRNDWLYLILREHEQAFEKGLYAQLTARYGGSDLTDIIAEVL